MKKLNLKIQEKLIELKQLHCLKLISALIKLLKRFFFFIFHFILCKKKKFIHKTPQAFLVILEV